MKKLVILALIVTVLVTTSVALSTAPTYSYQAWIKITAQPNAFHYNCWEPSCGSSFDYNPAWDLYPPLPHDYMVPIWFMSPAQPPVVPFSVYVLCGPPNWYPNWQPCLLPDGRGEPAWGMVRLQDACLIAPPAQTVLPGLAAPPACLATLSTLRKPVAVQQRSF